MTKQTIQKAAIQYRQAILIPENTSQADNSQSALMFQHELMRLGYMLDRQVFEKISTLPDTSINDLFRDILPILWTLKGGDKKWRIFYPNFPKQVMKASEAELFFNAIVHYWSFGRWSPDYPLKRRRIKVDAVKLTPLKLGSVGDTMSVFTELLGSNTSLSESQATDLEWFLKTYGDALAPYVPETIPFKEQLCRFLGICMQHNLKLADKQVCTATDVLRLMTHLSDGDISLATNTKFRSWKRAERRHFASMLEKTINTSDIARHGEKWVRAFHGLHIGDYAKLAPTTFKIADELRNGNLKTHHSRIEAAIIEKDTTTILQLLRQYPGEMARRLDHLLRSLPAQDAARVIEQFAKVASKIDSRVLIQIYGHFKNRGNMIESRVVMPKGLESRAQIIRKTLAPLPQSYVSGIIAAVTSALEEIYSSKAALGKVWIDPALLKFPVPLSQRSASESLRSVARGSRIPLSNKNTLRMFIWWIGQDVDLSCVLYDENFRSIGHISYTNLRIKEINCCHSGDITHAPKGAAEFIDIDMDMAQQAGARYIAMNVLDYTGKKFANYDECFAGWMTREHPNSNEVYDARSVEQKIDLRSNSTHALPVLFDLTSREAVWMDLTTQSKKQRANNVENNSATINDHMKAALLLNNKLSLYELFGIHTQARGQRVENKEEADTIFSIEEGITPFDISKIGADYV